MEIFLGVVKNKQTGNSLSQTETYYKADKLKKLKKSIQNLVLKI